MSDYNLFYVIENKSGEFFGGGYDWYAEINTKFSRDIERAIQFTTRRGAETVRNSLFRSDSVNYPVQEHMYV